MDLKKLYTKYEMKYYNFLEKLNETVPVTKVTDAVDKIVPSFAVMLGVIVLLVLGIAYVGITSVGPQEIEMTFKVVDDLSVPVEGAELLLTYGGQEHSFTTNESGEFLLSIPQGTKIKALAKKTDYEEKEKVFEAKSNEPVIVLEMRKLITAKQYTIQLLAEDGSLVDEQAEISFMCTQGGGAPGKANASNGFLQISANPTCIGLYADVVSQNFKGKKALSEGANTIHLAEYESPKGNIKVTVEDKESNRISGVDLTLSTFENSKVKGPAKTFNGEVTFSEVPTGDYHIYVNDPKGVFADARHEAVRVYNGETATPTIIMSRNKVGDLKVKVKDKDTKQFIPGANAKLFKDRLQVTESQILLNGTVFGLTHFGNYTLQVYHDDYLSKELAVTFTQTTTVEIELEKITAENSGQITVTVLDEEGKPVEDATVYPFNANTNQLHPASPQKTDSYGEAKFKGFERGKYYFKAIKGLVDGKSSSNDIDVGTVNSFSVRIERGTGTIRVEAKDLENNAIPFATIEVKAEGTGQTFSDITDQEGAITFNLKGESMVYFRVSKEGYTAYTSQTIRIEKDKEKGFTAFLEPPIPGKEPLIVLLGLFGDETTTEPVSEVQPGNTYIARLQVKIPESFDYKELGVHLRTGDTELLEKDDIYIKSISAPNSAVFKGKSYNPPQGLQEDMQNISYADAKWANIKFNDLNKGVFNLSAEIVVRNRVVSGDKLPIYYRVLAVSADGEFARTPFDSELGTARATSSKDELYAKANEKVYWAGLPQLCDDSFCYSGQRVLDLDEKIYRNEPYIVAVNGNFELTFDITNNSDAIHDNAEIRFKNVEEGKLVGKNLKITSYKIVNADAQIFEQQETALNELNPIPLGNFVRNRSITANIEFVPKQVGESFFEMQIVSDKKIVFVKRIAVSAANMAQMNLNITPEIIPAFVDSQVLIKAADEEEIALSDVKIIVSKIASNNTKAKVGEYFTNLNGNASIELPSSSPNSRFVIEAEKPGYAVEIKELRVKEEIVSFEPEAFSVELDAITQRETIASAQITNLIGLDLIISEAKIAGYFKGLLDLKAMDDYLEQYKDNTVFEKGKTREEDFFKARLTEGVNPKRAETLEGDIFIKFRNKKLQKDWGIMVPFTAQIGLGEMPATECFVLEGDPEWDAVSEGDEIATEFVLVNRCQSDTGTPIALNNLRVELKQPSSKGVASITVINPETQETTGKTTLVEGEKIKLMPTIEPRTEYIVNIYFTPKPNKLGETQEFTLSFTTEAATDAGMQEKKANKEFKADISMINLSDCIKTDPQYDIGIKMKGNENEKTFKVDVSECKGAKIDLWLCKGDPNCKGGTIDGGIIFNNNPNPQNVSGEKEFEIQRTDVPGIYGIDIYARPEGKSSYQFVKTLDVVIEPGQGFYFSLDKYKFTLLEQGSKDTATLKNSMFIEDVEVTADMCAWGHAVDKNPELAIMGSAGLTYLALRQKLITGVGRGGTAAAMWLVLFIILQNLLEGSCSDEIITQTVTDYIIDLVDDKLAIESTEHLIAMRYSDSPPREYQDQTTEELVQEYGAIFENIGLFQDTPVYAIGTFKATEHVHGDDTHTNAKTTCTTGFHNLYVPAEICDPAEDKTYEQKFHLRFDTRDRAEDLPPVRYDVESCGGILAGQTGKGAKPEINLSWEWIEGIGRGIKWNSCDEIEGDSHYCDATQFTIASMKRLHWIDELLKANSYSLPCPEGAEETSPEYEKEEENDVDNGKFGISKLNIDVSQPEGKATATIYLKNQSGAAKTIDVDATLRSFSTEAIFEDEQECRKTGITIPAYETVETECEFTNIQNGTYGITATPSSADTENLQTNELTVSFSMESSITVDCWAPRTTKAFSGESLLVSYLKGLDTINWPTDWETKIGPKDTTTVERLLHFDAKLIRDGYTPDFRRDFARYYSDEKLAGTYSWFANSGEEYQFRDYLENTEKMSFSQRYIPGEHTLPEGAIYKVDLLVDFGDEWNFFDDHGKPRAEIDVQFYKLRNAVPNSPFYNMPLDGLVGLEGTAFNRQGYGTMFVNQGELIKINDSLVESNLKTFSDSGSNALIEVKVNNVKDLKRMNADLSTRGNLFALREGTTRNSKVFEWTPNLATPTVLKTTHGLTNDGFGTYYAILENETAVEAGTNLTYWEGMGQCFDFTGAPVSERFDFSSDRAAQDSDNIRDWATSYTVQWDRAVKSGDVYLRTILYTPRGSENAIRIVHPLDKAEIITPDGQGEVVVLRGVSGMQHNNSGATQDDVIDSIQDLLDLVESKKVCVASNGLNTRFFWNEKAVYGQGTNNITVMSNTLGTTRQCIQ